MAKTTAATGTKKIKTPESIRCELEARVAQLKAPMEPEIKESVALREAVANRVFEIMQAQNVTQAELARRLGTSRAYVCKILGGGANLTLDSLGALSVALGCRLEVRLSDSGQGARTSAQTSGYSHWKAKRPISKRLRHSAADKTKTTILHK
jgi:transcriptional regulator with XRE-family HTH domain